MKKQKAQENLERVKEKRKNGLILESLKATLKLALLTIIISGLILCGKALVDNKEYIKNRSAAKKLAMTYTEVKPTDNATQSEYVKFDAYFLQSAGGNSTKKVRGVALELNDTQEFYIELNVLTNGYIENGRISIDTNNYKIARGIATDNEIYSVWDNGMKFNKISNGTYKTIPILIGQRVYEVGDLSGINSITFTGTHVAENGTRTQITKTVKFQVDWYGSKNINEFFTINTHAVANKELNQVVISMGTYADDGSETQSKYKQVPNKAGVITTTIPLLNGYAPTSVTVTDGAPYGKRLTYNYDKNTRKLSIRNEMTGEYDSGCYKSWITIIYPYKAYETIGQYGTTIQFVLQCQLEGHNNPNKEFENPVKSKIAKYTRNLYIYDIEGDVISVDTYIYNVTKSNLRLKYDRNIETDNGYNVRWRTKINIANVFDKVILEEDNSTTQANPLFKTDVIQGRDGTYYSLDGMVSYVGINVYDETFQVLGEDGYVKVINSDTNEVIQTITKDQADKTVLYKNSAKHIRIETSKPKNTGRMTIYHMKKIDNAAFVKKYTKAQFNDMNTIYTAVNGNIERSGKKSFVERDVAMR